MSVLKDLRYIIITHTSPPGTSNLRLQPQNSSGPKRCFRSGRSSGISIKQSEPPVVSSRPEACGTIETVHPPQATIVLSARCCTPSFVTTPCMEFPLLMKSLKQPLDSSRMNLTPASLQRWRAHTQHYQRINTLPYQTRINEVSTYFVGSSETRIHIHHPMDIAIHETAIAM